MCVYMSVYHKYHDSKKGIKSHRIEVIDVSCPTGVLGTELRFLKEKTQVLLITEKFLQSLKF